MDGGDQLGEHVVQVDETWQCWWLALLEVARISGKLKPLFETKGNDFYDYRHPPASSEPRAIPEAGEVPANVVYILNGEPIPEDQVPKPLSKEAPLGRWVYGPVWQRKIMYYLLDRDNNRAWSKPDAIVVIPGRSFALTNLLTYLGITGITFGTPWSNNGLKLKEALNELPQGQNVLADKTNTGGRTGHSMSGIVGSQDASGSPGDSICTYNQSWSKQDFVTFDLKEDSGKYILVSESGDKLSWFMPVMIAS
ncbi:hypothetical protein F66182_5221 [Fusarium sp. NRRL 66182]|nr:hypothetical protein F66182_5221 [Fusarium sp. NRRL 66182]